MFKESLQSVDCHALGDLFNQWCQQWLRPTAAQWVGGDGKSIRSTRSAQGANFITTVSWFTHTPGTVVALAVMENAKTSEIRVIRALIEQLSDCPGLVFTLDALHCQTATVELIVQQQQHDLIAVKGNQKYLWKTLTQWVSQASPLSVAHQQDNTHRRQVVRTVAVYDAPAEIRARWSQCSRVVWVQRTGIRNGKPFCTHSAYITDLPLSAAELIERIQQRWDIENRLHWVRDVTFCEDAAPRQGGHAPVNWAILHCWLITVVRQLGCQTIPQGMRFLSNQLLQVIHILLHGFSSA